LFFLVNLLIFFNNFDFSEEEGEEENTEENFNTLISNLNQKNKLIQPIKGMVVAHTTVYG